MGYSKSGFRPVPKITIDSEGCDMQKDSCLCRCSDWHDMYTPHWHKVLPVDLAVKRTVVEGAFRLLQQVRLGSQRPCVEAYMLVDVAGADLYSLLTSVEKLFTQSGLQGDWRAASAKQRLREVFGVFVEEHRLTTEELDLLSSQSVYKYASDLSPAVEPLQLFDFLELLKKIGSRVFATEPRRALDLTITALEASLTGNTVPEVCKDEVVGESMHLTSPAHALAADEEEIAELWSLLQD